MESAEEENLGARRKPGKGKKDKKLGHRKVREGGQVVYKEVETNVLMGSIQRGIQQSVGGLASSRERDLLMKDFEALDTSQFPSKGGHQTPAHSFPDFTFRTYASVAFRYFRDLFGIPPAKFMVGEYNICLTSLFK